MLDSDYFFDRCMILGMIETPNLQLINVISTTLSGLQDGDRVPWSDESLRRKYMSNMVISMINELEKIGVGSKLEGLQINQKQVLFVIDGQTKLVSLPIARNMNHKFFSTAELYEKYMRSLDLKELPWEDGDFK